jgi:hypothetical protein
VTDCIFPSLVLIYKCPKVRQRYGARYEINIHSRIDTYRDIYNFAILCTEPGSEFVIEGTLLIAEMIWDI